MLPTLTGVTVTQGGAAWVDPLPAGDVQLSALDLDNLNVLHIDPSTAYLGSSTALTLSLDGVPDLLPAWQVSIVVEGESLSVSRATPSERLETIAAAPIALQAKIGNLTRVAVDTLDMRSRLPVTGEMSRALARRRYGATARFGMLHESH